MIGRIKRPIFPQLTLPNNPPQSGDTITATPLVISWREDGVEFATQILTPSHTLANGQIGKKISTVYSVGNAVGGSDKTVNVIATLQTEFIITYGAGGANVMHIVLDNSIALAASARVGFDVTIGTSDSPTATQKAGKFTDLTSGQTWTATVDNMNGTATVTDSYDPNYPFIFSQGSNGITYVENQVGVTDTPGPHADEIFTLTFP